MSIKMERNTRDCFKRDCKNRMSFRSGGHAGVGISWLDGKHVDFRSKNTGIPFGHHVVKAAFS